MGRSAVALRSAGRRDSGCRSRLDTRNRVHYRSCWRVSRPLVAHSGIGSITPCANASERCLHRHLRFADATISVKTARLPHRDNAHCFAMTFALQRPEYVPGVLFGFFPGSYVAGLALRRDSESTWADLIQRCFLCAFGGAVSLPILSTIGLLCGPPNPQGPFPEWVFVVLACGLAIWGFGLGAVYGFVETLVLRTHSPAPPT